MTRRPVLRRGARGPAVVALKTALASQGFWPWPLSGSSAVYGPRTLESVEYFQSTHLGPNGHPLDVDGVVGSATWWALTHASGAAQRSRLPSSVPAGLGPQRAALLAEAVRWHGVRERPNGSNRGPDVDRFLPGWAHTQPGPPWCCFYMCKVAHTALGSHVLGRHHGSCHRAWAAAQERGRARTSGEIWPGDAFMMLRTGGTGHTGFVLRVSANGREINTCEGNCGNRVKVGRRAVDTLAGWIRLLDEPPTDAYRPGLIEASDVAGSGTR